MYHGFGPDGDPDLDHTPMDLFRKQVQYIHKHYIPMTLKDLAGHKAASDRYPRRVVVITVDDEYSNFHELA